jgi:hypothetical protein
MVSTVRWIHRLALPLVAALVLLGAASPAFAHKPLDPELIQPLAAPSLPAAPAPDRPPEPRAPGVPWQAVVLSLAAVSLGFHRPRRALAGTLVICLAVLLLETGIHSVHHGADSHGAATCATHCVSQHLVGTDIEIPDLRALPVAFHRVVAARAEQSLDQRPLGSVLGRAPPLNSL